MTLVAIAKATQKVVVDNSPLILTILGATGVVSTAYLTAKATAKAVRILDNASENHGYLDPQTSGYSTLTKKETVKLVWPLYISAVSTGAMTITCVLMANRIGTKRAAALASGWAIAEKGFEEYREKVVEKLGAKKEAAARDEMAQERISREGISQNTVIVGDAKKGSVLCFDSYSGRTFKSDHVSLLNAQVQLGLKVLRHDFATLNDFYAEVGIPGTKTGSDLGWHSDNPMEIILTSVLTEENEPAIHVDFLDAPKPQQYNTL